MGRNSWREPGSSDWPAALAWPATDDEEVALDVLLEHHSPPKPYGYEWVGVIVGRILHRDISATIRLTSLDALQRHGTYACGRTVKLPPLDRREAWGPIIDAAFRDLELGYAVRELVNRPAQLAGKESAK